MTKALDVIPKTVAIAVGPNMSCIASGTKAMLADAAPVPSILLFPDGEDEKSSKPIFISIIPPTIRTS